MPEEKPGQGQPTPPPAQPDLPVLDLEKIEELSGELLDKPFAKTPDGQPVTFKTFREGWMKDRDYRRKTAALAEERKNQAGQSETINTLRTELDDIKGRLARGEITSKQARDEAEQIELTGIPELDKKVATFVRSEVGKVKSEYEKKFADQAKSDEQKAKEAKEQKQMGELRSQIDKYLASNKDKCPDIEESDILWCMVTKTDTDGRPFDIEDIPHLAKLCQQRFDASHDRRTKAKAEAKEGLPANPKETPPPAKPPEGDDDEAAKRKFIADLDGARKKEQGIVV